MTIIRVKTSDAYAALTARRLDALGLIPEAACVEVLLGDRMTLAQALRQLRDTAASVYVQTVARRALEECGLAEPADEEQT